MSTEDQTPRDRRPHFGVERTGKQAPLSSHPKNAPLTNRAPPRRVDHTYRDFSQFYLNEPHLSKKASVNFPAKLHQILSNPDCSHIISWMPHGRSWKIHNKELLISEVIPKFFSHTKIESFTRQRNGWGFKRLHQAGNDFNAYYHECCIRGRPDLIGMMKRVSSNQGRSLPHVEGEPNFYEIDKQFPLSPSMQVNQSQFQYPSSHMEAGVGYGAPQNPHVGYHTSPSQFSSVPGIYGPPPPFYGHCVDPNGAGTYPQMGGYPPYPLHCPMQHDHQPYEQYPYSSYPRGPPRFISSHHDNGLPSGMAIPLQSDKPANDSL